MNKPKTATPPPLVVNAADVPETVQMDDAHWGSAYKPLTPALDALGQQGGGARLGMNLSRVPPGRSGCPFHAHAREDEVFYVISGRGLFRHGDTVREIGPGDCISCPAGTGTAHQIANPFEGTSQLAQTTLRSVLGQHELDEMLAGRDKLNADIQQILDRQTDVWGIKVSTVEIKHIDLNEGMIRAIAKQAEAERTRRAKVIAAEGELQASERLTQAARVLSGDPRAITLRYLQSMLEMSNENRGTTIVFPLPMDLLHAIGPRHREPPKTGE